MLFRSQTEEVKQVLPPEGVKSFEEIHFNGTSRRGVVAVIVPHQLLCNQNVVTNLPPRNKGNLGSVNEVRQYYLNASSEHSRDALV